MTNSRDLLANALPLAPPLAHSIQSQNRDIDDESFSQIRQDQLPGEGRLGLDAVFDLTQAVPPVALNTFQENAPNIKKDWSQTFPSKLHHMLSDIENNHKELSSVVCFLPHGRAFKVFDQKRFVAEVLPL